MLYKKITNSGDSRIFSLSYIYCVKNQLLYFLFLADLEDDSDYLLPMININQISDLPPPLNEQQSEETQQQQQQQQPDIDNDDAYVYFESPSSK